MCLPDFIEFKQIDESNSLIGYRNWRNLVENSLILKSENQNYEWNKLEGPHEVKPENSGIYSYNNYNNYYNYYYNYNNYYYDHNYNYNNYYDHNHDHNNYYNYNNNIYLNGIINQWGKVAIHKLGYRSEYAKINTLFSIRELDMKGPKEFQNWIKIFNERINQIAEKYECKIISWQDFKELNK